MALLVKSAIGQTCLHTLVAIFQRLDPILGDPSLENLESTQAASGEVARDKLNGPPNLEFMRKHRVLAPFQWQLIDVYLEPAKGDDGEPSVVEKGPSTLAARCL